MELHLVQVQTRPWWPVRVLAGQSGGAVSRRIRTSCATILPTSWTLKRSIHTSRCVLTLIGFKRQRKTSGQLLVLSKFRLESFYKSKRKKRLLFQHKVTCPSCFLSRANHLLPVQQSPQAWPFNVSSVAGFTKGSLALLCS